MPSYMRHEVYRNHLASRQPHAEVGGLVQQAARHQNAGIASRHHPHGIGFQGPYSGQLAQSIISQRHVSPGLLTSLVSPGPTSPPSAFAPPRASAGQLRTPPTIAGAPTSQPPRNDPVQYKAVSPATMAAAFPALKAAYARPRQAQ